MWTSCRAIARSLWPHLICVATFLFTVSPINGQDSTPNIAVSDDARQLAEISTETQISQNRINGQISLLTELTERLSAAPLPEAATSAGEFKSTLTKNCADLLDREFGPIETGLRVAADKHEKELAALQRTWNNVLGQLNQANIELAQLESTHAGTRSWIVASLENRWFWLAALFAVSVFALVAWHERRHEYRRSLSGSSGRALGVSRLLQATVVLLAIVTMAVFFLGRQIFDRVTGTSSSGAISRSAIVAANDQASAALSKSQTHLRQKQEDVYRRLTSGQTETGFLLESMPTIERLAGILAAREYSAEALSSDIGKLQAVLEKRRFHESEIAALKSRAQRVRIGMSLGVVAMTIGLAFPLLRGVKRRQQFIAATCPLCLGVGTLEPEKSTTAQTGNLTKLRCRRVLEYLNMECGFSFLSVYQNMPKLCFPTIGHPASGKTHWLTMVYRDLNQGQGNTDKRLQFQKVKSSQSEDFDRLVDEIINARLATGATQTAQVPFPLLFNFSDNDRWGRSNALLNIFDYSGEVTRSMSLEDGQRQRMLNADGYFFFLDPTKRSEEQAKELVDFAEDVQVVKGTKAGRSLKVPVALCVSKIDLLVNEDYADRDGSGAVSRFYDSLAEYDTGNEISLDAIRGRSRLMHELRHTIWPGWEIEQQIDHLFGGRYMYFPMTPVGLNELGETDLTRRTISPRWILEPLLWLLQMNGYRVFN